MKTEREVTELEGRLAVKTCEAITAYRNEPAVTLTGQPNERKTELRQAKNKAYELWKEYRALVDD